MDVDENELDSFKRKCIELGDENASLKHENNELWKELAKARGLVIMGGQNSMPNL